MELIYKCRCMKEERKIVVTDRVRESDMAAWMQMVVEPSITYDHGSMNRLCQSHRMQYVKILIDEDQPVGVPRTKN